MGYRGVLLHDTTRFYLVVLQSLALMSLPSKISTSPVVGISNTNNCIVFSGSVCIVFKKYAGCPGSALKSISICGLVASLIVSLPTIWPTTKFVWFVDSKTEIYYP
jgi:hypothetical protein